MENVFNKLGLKHFWLILVPCTMRFDDVSILLYGKDFCFSESFQNNIENNKILEMINTCIQTFPKLEFKRGSTENRQGIQLSFRAKNMLEPASSLFEIQEGGKPVSRLHLHWPILTKPSATKPKTHKTELSLGRINTQLFHTKMVLVEFCPKSPESPMWQAKFPI